MIIKILITPFGTEIANVRPGEFLWPPCGAKIFYGAPEILHTLSYFLIILLFFLLFTNFALSVRHWPEEYVIFVKTWNRLFSNIVSYSNILSVRILGLVFLNMDIRLRGSLGKYGKKPDHPPPFCRSIQLWKLPFLVF